MLQIGRFKGSAHRRTGPRMKDGRPMWRVDIITPESITNGTPQLFAVEMSPGSSLGTHFHFQDQFQLVVKGGGTMGRQDITPMFVHYASGHTGYGPLVAGEQGLTYLTIRAVADGDAHYLPQSRPEMLAVKRRNAHATYLPTPVDGARLPAWSPVIPQQDNGAGAWALGLGSGELYRAGPDAGSRYYFVASGSVQVMDEELSDLDCVFLSGDDASTPLVAGQHGAQLLVLQFDRAA